MVSHVASGRQSSFPHTLNPQVCRRSLPQVFWSPLMDSTCPQNGPLPAYEYFSPRIHLPHPGDRGFRVHKDELCTPWTLPAGPHSRTNQLLVHCVPAISLAISPFGACPKTLLSTHTTLSSSPSLDNCGPSPGLSSEIFHCRSQPHSPWNPPLSNFPSGAMITLSSDCLLSCPSLK